MDKFQVTLKPLDECCFQLTIKIDGEEVETGVWCPVSHKLAIDGNLIGFAKTKEELLERLTPYQVTKFYLKEPAK